MDLVKAQQTRLVHIPELLSSSEIDQVSRLGIGLLQEVDGAEVRYDAGMLPTITLEQERLLRTFPQFQKTFPVLAAQVKAAKIRTDRAADLLVASGVEVRSYGSDNAWHVAYLQANSLLETLLPDVVLKIRNAAVEADQREGWGLFDECNCPFNVRCAEYHRQRAPSAALPDKHHYDQDSLITVDIMLNSGFQGGDFCTLDTTGHLSTHSFHQEGDAMIFVSHKYHSVRPITRGQRRVLVVEFWRGPARQCAHRCNMLAGTCPLESTGMTQVCTLHGLHRWCSASRCLRSRTSEVELRTCPDTIPQVAETKRLKSGRPGCAQYSLNMDLQV